MHLEGMAPGSVTFDAEEKRRMTRVRIAERLHVFPSQVDQQPYMDVMDMLDVWSADQRTADAKARK